MIRQTCRVWRMAKHTHSNGGDDDYVDEEENNDENTNTLSFGHEHIQLLSLALYANSIVEGAHQSLHDTQLETFFSRNINDVATIVGRMRLLTDQQAKHEELNRQLKIKNSSL